MTSMVAARFFETTRGRIVTALRGRRGASAFELAAQFGLSPNAVRQQLTILERDGLVAGRAVRRGKTKPTLEFALTPAADRLFPQRYDVMLNAVLREVRATGGEAAVTSIFAAMATRTAERLRAQFDAGDIGGAVNGLATFLRDQGVDVDVERTGEAIILREHNCPYARTVVEHPEVCTLIHTLLKEVVPGEAKQTESLATGGTECRFEIPSIV